MATGMSEGIKLRDGDIDIASNYLPVEYSQNSSIVEMLLQCTIYAMKHSRSNIVFKIPEYWHSKGIKTIKDAIEKLGLILDFDSIITAISTSITDHEIVMKLNLETYKFIMYVIDGYQKLNIIEYKLINPSIMLDDGKDKREITNQQLRQFKVNYSDAFESQFAAKGDQLKSMGMNITGTQFLYHGTPLENACSIIGNGIKNASGGDASAKQFFLNGAAHGNGIYLSNQLRTSLGYTRGEYGFILVYEVYNNPEWRKTNDIFVIPDEQALILRYFLVFDNSISAYISEKLSEQLNYKLSSGKQKEIEDKVKSEKATHAGKVKNRRIIMEFKSLNTPAKVTEGLTVKLAEPDIYEKWLVYLEPKYLDNPVMAEQMKKLNIPYIEMEIIFPEKFPFEALFPRIIKPCMQQGSYITRGGTFCLDLLYSKWAPALKFESILLAIKNLMVEGKARIDEANYDTPYKYADAIESYKNVENAHGDWKLEKSSIVDLV